MINFLILYELSRKVYTMYGISNQLKKNLSVFMTPSFGTIKPALNRLEKSGFITSQKHMSKGGRLSVYYAITDKGRNALKEELLSPCSDNPTQFLTNARLRLCCSDVLGDVDSVKMLNILKTKTQSIKLDAENMLSKYDKQFCRRMVFDDFALELGNFLKLLEGIERACKH